MNESQSADTDMLDLTERAKLAIEENVGLKAYIASMNNECLELNAALFEEANKRVNAAMKKQYLAEKRAKELLHQNDILQSEVRALKAMIADLPIPVTDSEVVQSTKSSRSQHKSRQTNSRGGNLKSVPMVYRQSCGNLSMLDRSPIDSTLNRVGRSILLDAMLTEPDFESPDRQLFQKFLDWLKMGCPLNLISSSCANISNGGSLSSLPRSRVLIVRENAFGDHTDPSNTLSKSASVVDQSEFMRHLYTEDVKFCLNFDNSQLTDAIYRALPTCALEMVPLGRQLISSSRSSLDSSNDQCPLMSLHDAQYLLTIQNTLDPYSDSADVVVRISAAARNRIAAVTNLFQYLGLIKRGLASPTKSSNNFDVVDANADSNYNALPELERQFRKIQRLRLVIAFARLGFGVPDAE